MTGKSAVKALLAPAYKKVKKAPKVENEEEAAALLIQNPPTPSGQLKPLALAKEQGFDPAAYYVWLMAGSPLSTYIGSAAMVVVILASVMFPLWPPIMRQGVSYLSMGVLGLIGLFIAVAVVRLVVWMATRLVLKKAIWWFPNLFEDVGFVDSFIPFWAWDEPAQPALASGKSKTSKSSKEKRSGKSKTSTSAPQALIEEATAALTGASTPVSGGENDATKSAAAEGGLGDEPSTGATALESGKGSAMEVGGDANMRKRQMAYVEDAEE
ncbi:hypothetical protein QFC19_002673 [Naganishia cerealis]|uniref:Uncharacterized protein n=1 Tax=Naganishia cerealis TaxID=610337 RepID=A0ACC2W9D8_9TREE|nr:hypothetical protein QFC19_002673 [Naganishia cerealis]